MSAVCSVCNETICTPDTIWYVGTRFSWNVQWVCGKCLSKIPKSYREPTDVIRLHELSFGELHAETNSRGVYQGMSSKQGAIEFWVSADNIEQVFSENCDCLCDLYPFYRIDAYLAWLAGRIRSGVYSQPDAARTLQRTLVLIGPAAESHLLNRTAAELVRKLTSPYSLCDVLTDLQLTQISELEQLILDQYKSAGVE